MNNLTNLLIKLKDPRTNWKYILIVVILAFLVGGGILGYLKYIIKEIISLTQFSEIKKTEKVVEDKTADWKVYRNEEYGFEIKYPGNWVMKYDNLSVAFFPTSVEQHPFIAINVKPNPQKLSIQEFYNGINDRNLFEQSNNEYTIGQIRGKFFYKFIPYITFSGEVIIVIPLDKAFLEIIDSGNAFPEVVNTMLSTLEFY